MPEKMFSGIKSGFFRVCWISGGKYRIATTCTILKRKLFFDVISLKVEKPIT